MLGVPSREELQLLGLLAVMVAGFWLALNEVREGKGSRGEGKQEEGGGAQVRGKLREVRGRRRRRRGGGKRGVGK